VDVDVIPGASTTFDVLCGASGRGTDPGTAYLFVLGPGGRYGLGSVYQKGHYALLFESSESTGAYRPQAANHVRADCSGGFLTMTLNGSRLFQVFDDQLRGGNVGFEVDATAQKAASAVFKNLVVRSEKR
jgi:hypothetical protein